MFPRGLLSYCVPACTSLVAVRLQYVQSKQPSDSGRINLVTVAGAGYLRLHGFPLSRQLLCLVLLALGLLGGVFLISLFVERDASFDNLWWQAGGPMMLIGIPWVLRLRHDRRLWPRPGDRRGTDRTPRRIARRWRTQRSFEPKPGTNLIYTVAGRSKSRKEGEAMNSSRSVPKLLRRVLKVPLGGSTHP